MKVSDIPLEQIHLAGTNPRQTFDPAALQELTESVRAHGILQPVLVRPIDGGFELVAGHRRLRAAEAAGLKNVPALVRDLDDRQALEAQVIENLQREDLHPLEEGAGYRRLCREHGYTATELAMKVSRSQSYIYSRMRLAELPARAQELFREGKLTLSTAQLVARLSDEAQAVEAAEHIAAGDRVWDDGQEVIEPLGFRDALVYLRREVLLRLENAPFDTTDAELAPPAGACTTCPKRTGNQPMLFAEDVGADRCTDRACWRVKADAFFAQRLESGKAREATRDEAKQVLLGGRLHTWRAREAGFVDLNEPCFEDEKGRTWAKLLGKQVPEAVLVQEPETGRTVELVPLAAAWEVVQRKHAWARRDEQEDGDDHEEDVADAEPRHPGPQAVPEWKVRSLVAELALSEIQEHIEAIPERVFLELVLESVLHAMAFDPSDLVAGSWKPPAELGEDPMLEEVVTAFVKHTESWTVPQLRATVLRAEFGDSAPKAVIERAAAAAGVDLKKLEARVRRDLKKQAKAAGGSS